MDTCVHCKHVYAKIIITSEIKGNFPSENKSIINLPIAREIKREKTVALQKKTSSYIYLTRCINSYLCAQFYESCLFQTSELTNMLYI